MKKFILAICESIVLILIVLSLISIANQYKELTTLQYFFVLMACTTRAFLKYDIL